MNPESSPRVSTLTIEDIKATWNSIPEIDRLLFSIEAELRRLPIEHVRSFLRVLLQRGMI